MSAGQKSMKLWGLLLVLAASTALGMQAGGSLRRRVHSLQELTLLMEMLKNEIQYSAAPLPEIFLLLAGRTGESFGRFLRAASEEMKKRDGRSLEEILRISSQGLIWSAGLTQRDLDALANLGGRLGYSDRFMQLRILEGYLRQLRFEEAEALDAMQKKEGLYRCLGFMAGLFFAVLLY